MRKTKSKYLPVLIIIKIESLTWKKTSMQNGHKFGIVHEIEHSYEWQRERMLKKKNGITVTH